MNLLLWESTLLLSYVTHLSHQQMLLILSLKHISSLFSISALISRVYTSTTFHIDFYNPLLTGFFALTLAFDQPWCTGQLEQLFEDKT